ncbi:DUF4268 domain-containing protein [Methanobacterium formicicum]|uniref:DUF4268 domain-containing protein n=1 Tax=Methanobacterium formicicum TaxID=2162 RepID=UPI002FE22496
MKFDLGDIKEVPLRNFFPKEDLNFTPWLAENITLLGETIGLELTDSITEFPIGNYRLDILAEESGTNRTIVIENQFGTTDHSHLGQLITYMAGADADVVIWLAEEFNNEHITAVNHLNQISNDDISFFCIKPRLIKIGDSKPAIEFLVKAKPDEWEKTIKSEQQITDRESKYKKFWTDFVSEMKQSNPKFKHGRIPKGSAYMFSAGIPGVTYAWRFSRNKEYNLTLWIDTGDKSRNNNIFDMIYQEKNKIDNEIGIKLKYSKKENARLNDINLTCDITADVVEINDKDRNELIKWSIKYMPKFKGALDPILKKCV